MLLLNFVLAAVWMAVQRSFTIADFVVGFVFSFAIVALVQRTLGQDVYPLRRRQELPPQSRNYVLRTWHLFSFLIYGLWSIIKANIDVARVVLSPRMDIKPGFVAVPLDVKSDVGITILSNIITLTPGTVTLDVASDRKKLYVHALNVGDPDALRRDIKHDFERRIREFIV
ncbi:MAG: Na+/H+ antiporter subunit E [Chloroflexales bacterium]|nr:Na+/H+ antiporter subunit E [Chloroflexales bacterium]